MPGTRVDGILQQSKRFLNPGSIRQKVLVPQHDISKGFGTPTTKLKIGQQVFVPLLQLYNSFHTPDKEQKKIPKFLIDFLS